jgi:DMSO/TMAO reductase YedYZ molybdopterin-dependent catalytic subunit
LREGREQVADLVGGINAWQASTTNGGDVASPVVRGRSRTVPPAAGKDPRLVIWSDEPLNAETPPELLGARQLTPNEVFFVRNHGPIPEVDPAAYRLMVRGLVAEPLALSLEDLRQGFEHLTVEALLACAGNRRNELAAITPIPEQAPWVRERPAMLDGEASG